MTELVGAVNGLLDRNDQLSRELVRMAEIVGRDGRITERAPVEDASGAWATNVDSLNKLVDDLVRPTTELARVIG